MSRALTYSMIESARAPVGCVPQVLACTKRSILQGALACLSFSLLRFQTQTKMYLRKALIARIPLNGSGLRP